MSWRDTMRLRRWADMVRAAGWVNVLVCVLAAAAIHDRALWLALSAWLAVSSIVFYAAARQIDRRASRVIGR